MIKAVVVEDEYHIRKGFIHSNDWTAMGCCIIGEPSNGKEGFEKILKHKPELVFADIEMPGMDGFEVAELMRQRKDTQNIPIVFVTAISKEDKYIFSIVTKKQCFKKVICLIFYILKYKYFLIILWFYFRLNRALKDCFIFGVFCQNMIKL